MIFPANMSGFNMVWERKNEMLQMTRGLCWKKEQPPEDMSLGAFWISDSHLGFWISVIWPCSSKWRLLAHCWQENEVLLLVPAHVLCLGDALPPGTMSPSDTLDACAWWARQCPLQPLNAPVHWKSVFIFTLTTRKTPSVTESNHTWMIIISFQKSDFSHLYLSHRTFPLKIST